jgi:hypothetical protein
VSAGRSGSSAHWGRFHPGRGGHRAGSFCTSCR